MVARRAFILGLTLALVGAGEPAQAKTRRRKRSAASRAVAGSGIGGGRGVSSDGRCPCNGGKVCVGPRGGRYCITSSGKKRYGV
jgi:hypothetical protein